MNLTRVLSGRAPRLAAQMMDTDVGVTRHGILEKQRLDRRIAVLPHKDVNRHQVQDWHRLQTNTFLNLRKVHIMYPDRYPDTCPRCGDIPTLTHITYGCPERPASVDWTDAHNTYVVVGGATC